MRLSLFFVPKELYLLIGLIPNRLIKQEQLSCFKRQIWEVTIGVVVNPVRLESLEKFGSPQFVADKLIQAEKRKVTDEMGCDGITSFITPFLNSVYI